MKTGAVGAIGAGVIAIGVVVGLGHSASSVFTNNASEKIQKTASEIEETEVPLSELTNHAPAIDRYSSDGLTLTQDEALIYIKEVYDEDGNGRLSSWEIKPAREMIGDIHGQQNYIFYPERKIVQPANLKTTGNNLIFALEKIIDEEKAKGNLLIK